MLVAMTFWWWKAFVKQKLMPVGGTLSWGDECSGGRERDTSGPVPDQERGWVGWSLGKEEVWPDARVAGAK